jgi:hypothetical protein
MEVVKAWIIMNKYPDFRLRDLSIFSCSFALIY